MDKKHYRTYYYLLDSTDTLHICSNGKSMCGVNAKKFHQVDDRNLPKYKVCENCLPKKETKSATFVTQAEIIDM